VANIITRADAASTSGSSPGTPNRKAQKTVDGQGTGNAGRRAN
jgi:hypothetical protein